MTDSGPVLGDGDSRPPRKHRSDQRGGRGVTKQDGYNDDIAQSRGHHPDRSRNRHSEERGQSRGDAGRRTQEGMHSGDLIATDMTGPTERYLGPHPGEEESRSPRKNKHDQRSGRSGERSYERDRPRDRDYSREDRGPGTARETQYSGDVIATGFTTADSGPGLSDGDSRAPRRHKHDQRGGRTATSEQDTQSGYSGEKVPSRGYQDRNGHRDYSRDDRTPGRSRDDPDRSRSWQYEDRGQKMDRDRGHSADPHQSDRNRQYYNLRGPDRLEENQARDYDYKQRDHARRVSFEKREKPGYPGSGRDPDDYSPSERGYPRNGDQMYDMEYEKERTSGILDCYQCRYLCSGRACCQLVEVLLNMLILICCSVSYNSTGGYTGITNLGGIYYYQFGGAYSGFSGPDGERAQKLDVEFYNLKLPTVTASMAFGGALMGFSCLFILLGVLRIPWRWPFWLLVEGALDVLIAVGYIPALYFYFTRLQSAYSSQVCTDRETLYSSKGYQGFTCALHGADIAAALFACMAIIAFFMSAVLAILGFRTVRRMKRKPNTSQF
ncbi:MARVEL domain-containing protein 3 [Hyperolius riggenbachi]|uniref:MARVEL domain-containing protein 3 n=1 Tax=Hyperolius riggenbachi TaxID=752182 RepID=UPI0035A31E1D